MLEKPEVVVRTLILCLAALLAAAPVPALAAEDGFEPAGRWRMLHTDGSAFHVTVHPDGRAESDFGEGERGAWRMEGRRLHLFWTDGWDDFVERRGEGFRKYAYGPGAERCGPPTNDGPAQKLE